MLYELNRETFAAVADRECGHPYLQPAGECELCDVDWLFESGELGEPSGYREDITAELLALRDASLAIAQSAERRLGMGGAA